MRFNLIKSKSNCFIRLVELQRSSIRIDSVVHLIIAAFVERTKIVPDFRKVRVDANGARVGIERVVVLIDLVVENTDRAPEGRVLAVSVDCLLVGFVCFAKVASGHISSTKQIPAEGVISVFEITT